MEMWKMLTQKFKDHSLNEEVLPFQQPQEVDDRDSGTESDEENAELQAIEEAAMQSQRDQENQPMVLTSGVGFRSSDFQTPTRSTSSPVNSVSKRPFQLVNQPSIPFQPLSHNTGFSQHYNTRYFEQESPQNSDYERCSLDYEPTSSLEFDRPSSEEELTIINCSMNREFHPEKRKWSQMNRCNSCNDSSSGSSDEEVRDLLCRPKPLNFSSSPPKGVQRLSQNLSPKLFLANLSPNNVRLCSVSPRKRHRQMSDVSDVTVMQRPCLDFEKMQKTLFRRHIPHGIAKARIVKIRLGILKGAM